MSLLEQITPTELNDLVQQVVTALQQQSTGVNEYPVVTSLSNVLSMPAYRGEGNDRQVVTAPVELLKGDQVELRNTGTEWQWKYKGDTSWKLLITVADLQKPAAEVALSVSQQMAQISDDWNNNIKPAVETATTNADNATTAANVAKEAANTAAANANVAKTEANDAAVAANTAATAANTATINANTATDAANAATTNATAATTAANAAKDAANTAASRANVAADNSEELNSHPANIQNVTWWLWDLSTGKYIDSTLPARGPEGKGPIVLANGNYGNWNDSTQTYTDSGVEAAATVDIQNASVAFTSATTRVTIESGESIPTLMGKVKKWFTDFGALAWKSTVNFSTEVTNKPTTVGGYGITDAGDMKKAVYDADNDGVVDEASNADRIEGKTIQNIVDENVTPAIATHNAATDAHPDIRNRVDQVEAIARGKSRARVFDTVDDLDTWLAVPANVAMLQIGDNFYIRETDVPDYWWDGAEKQPLESEKVVLPSPDYYTAVIDPTAWSVSTDANKGAYSTTIKREEITDGADVEFWPGDNSSEKAYVEATVHSYADATATSEDAPGSFTIYADAIPKAVISMNYKISWL